MHRHILQQKENFKPRKSIKKYIKGLGQRAEGKIVKNNNSRFILSMAVLGLLIIGTYFYKNTDAMRRSHL